MSGETPAPETEPEHDDAVQPALEPVVESDTLQRLRERARLLNYRAREARYYRD